MSLQVAERLSRQARQSVLGNLALACCIGLAHAADQAYSARGLSSASIHHPRQSRHRLRQWLVRGLHGLLRRVPRRITLDVRFVACASLSRLLLPSCHMLAAHSDGRCRSQLLPRPRISLRFDDRGHVSVATAAVAVACSKQPPGQPQLRPTQQTRRRRRRSADGAVPQSKHRRARLVSMDSAHDDQVTAWPSDAVAAATEPLSPADSASELPDLSSSWHKATATIRLPSDHWRNHARQPDTEACIALSSPQQPHSRASDTASTQQSQHANKSAGAVLRCRARAVESVSSPTRAAAEALRSHMLSDLDADDAKNSCSGAPQTAPRPTTPALPSSHLSPMGSSRGIDGGRPSAVTTDVAASNWVIPDACTGDSSSHLQSNMQQHTAVQSVGHDGGSGGCPSSVAAVLDDDHLLAFGALIGEAASAAAMTVRGGCGAVGDSPGCLFGASADTTCSWKLIVQVQFIAFVPIGVPSCPCLLPVAVADALD